MQGKEWVCDLKHPRCSHLVDKHAALGGPAAAQGRGLPSSQPVLLGCHHRLWRPRVALPPTSARPLPRGSSLPHFASPHTAPMWGPPDGVRPPLHPVLSGDSGGVLMAGTTTPSAMSSLPPTRAGAPGRGLGPDSHRLAGAVVRPRRGWGQGQLTCEAEIRETSCRPVRSEDETLAGAPLCSLMLTFLSLSTREIALGEVLPGRQGGGSGLGEEGEGSCPQHPGPWLPCAPDTGDPRPLPKVPAHQLAGYGRQGWKPQARLHCGAGWQRPPWVGQGAGPGLPTPGAAPSSPLARVLAAPGPRPRGFGLHPAGMRREPWSTLRGLGCSGIRHSIGVRAGEAGRGVCVSETLRSHRLPTKQVARETRRYPLITLHR